jgi:hypothetical protein
MYWIGEQCMSVWAWHYISYKKYTVKLIFTHGSTSINLEFLLIIILWLNQVGRGTRGNKSAVIVEREREIDGR